MSRGVPFTDEFVARAIDLYMGPDRPTIKALAKSLGVSPCALSRQFQSRGVGIDLRISGPAREDITGQKFGRLVAIRRVPDREHASRDLRAYWLCRCDCGAEKEIPRHYLHAAGSGVRSCGCSKFNAKAHGHARSRASGGPSPEYRVWRSMLNRCTNPKAVDWARYGGRGVTVCARWAQSFDAFLEDMGPRPAGSSIDRINNDGNYEPGNCRWSTPLEQGQNRRTSRLVTYDGLTLTATEWSRRLGGHLQIVHSRLDAGWSIADAVTRPPRG